MFSHALARATSDTSKHEEVHDSGYFIWFYIEHGMSMRCNVICGKEKNATNLTCLFLPPVFSMALRIESCADPGFFHWGGGWGSRPDGQKTVWTFLLLFFKSSTYFTFYRGGPMVLLQRKLYFSKDPEGVRHFPGGPTFSREGYRYPSRGSGPNIPSLYPHMRIYMMSSWLNNCC